jgi:hypothetical protein
MHAFYDVWGDAVLCYALSSGVTATAPYVQQVHARWPAGNAKCIQ